MSFLKHGYQKATKKGREALGRRGCGKCKILDGYQMATRGTFSKEKVPFFIFCPGFRKIFGAARGVVLG